MLKTRVITALVLLAILYLTTAWLSPFSFALFVSFVWLVAAYEWTGFIGLVAVLPRTLYIGSFALVLFFLGRLIGVHSGAIALDSGLARILCGIGVLFWLFAFLLIRVYPEQRQRWATRPRIAVIGFFTLLPTWVALVQLKYLNADGYLVFALVALVSSADIGAFFVGRAFGKSKLAPRLSPKKSWAGFWGGMGSCLILAIVLLYPLNRYVVALDLVTALALLAVASIVGAFSVLGDLFESMLKRNQDIKDSGHILPGHGGVLDRIDSLTAAAPVFVFSVMTLLNDVTWQ